MYNSSGSLSESREFKEEDMNPITKDTFEIEIQIEELEAKVAPFDGGETVLPLPRGRH